MAKIISLPCDSSWQDRYDVYTIVLDPEQFEREDLFLEAVKRYMGLAEEINAMD